MDWTRLLSRNKLEISEDGHVQVHAALRIPDNPSRSAYQQDHDRIVFSRPFRRLGRKTQVHPLALNDHTHNRLTHSVEVGAVGRSLGTRVGERLQDARLLPPDCTPYDLGTLVQVACLAHDIGNPPFGHTGEDALREWFRDPRHAAYLKDCTDAQRMDLQTYEGNAHALRILCTTEMYQGLGGMRLSCASIGAMLKYPWTSLHAGPHGKFNIYQTELPYFRAVARELGLIERMPDSCWARHPLSYLMEAADDICYAILDLEDAVEMGIISGAEFERLFADLSAELPPQVHHTKHRCAMIRSRFIGECISFVTDTFMQHYDALMEGRFVGKDFFDGSHHPCAQLLHTCKAFAQQRIYHHPSKLRKEVAAYPCLHHLLTMFVPAMLAAQAQAGAVTHRHKALLQLIDREPAPPTSPYEACMEVLDFIGGMTDNYALALAQETSGIGGA